MKIVIDKAIPFIEGRIKGAATIFLPGDEINREDVKDADALIIRTRTKCDASLLEGSNVKLIATATIGTDHIDLPWCENNGITVKSAPGCNAPGVAQYVFSSIFKCGFKPSAHTLGIIGYGNVGKIVAEWAAQMGIKTLIYDPPLEESGRKDVAWSSLEEVLLESDAVTLHVPMNKSGKYATLGMIGEKEMALMKEGSLLVNSSRGGIVDEKAFKNYIKSGKIRGIVDVWLNEPFIDHQLLKLVEIATPHIAGYSFEGKLRGTEAVLNALQSFFPGKLSIMPSHSYLNTCHSSLNISRQLIEISYDPLRDSEILKSNPEKFEEMRNNYNYRHEPLFYPSCNQKI